MSTNGAGAGPTEVGFALCVVLNSCKTRADQVQEIERLVKGALAAMEKPCPEIGIEASPVEKTVKSPQKQGMQDAAPNELAESTPRNRIKELLSMLFEANSSFYGEVRLALVEVAAKLPGISYYRPKGTDDVAHAIHQ